MDKWVVLIPFLLMAIIVLNLGVALQKAKIKELELKAYELEFKVNQIIKGGR